MDMDLTHRDMQVPYSTWSTHAHAETVACCAKRERGAGAEV